MKLWKKISLLTTSVLLVTTGVTGGIVVHRTVQYNETKTVENYEQQLHATAYALGKENSDSELEGVALGNELLESLNHGDPF